MADDKIRMPSSGAGLTSFYEESRSKVLVSPQAIIAITIIVAVVVLLLNNL